MSSSNKQTNKQTDRQTDKPNLDIDLMITQYRIKSLIVYNTNTSPISLTLGPSKTNFTFIFINSVLIFICLLVCRKP